MAGRLSHEAQVLDHAPSPRAASSSLRSAPPSLQYGAWLCSEWQQRGSMEEATMIYVLMPDILLPREESRQANTVLERKSLAVIWRSCLKLWECCPLHSIATRKSLPIPLQRILIRNCLIVFPSKHNKPCHRSCFYSWLLRNLKPHLQSPPSRIKYSTACNLCSIFISKFSALVSSFLLTLLFLF